MRHKRRELLSDKRALLDALGRCRARLLRDQFDLIPFCETYRAIDKVTVSIDVLAKHLTGDETFFHAKQTTPGLPIIKWKDNGL